MPSRTTRRPPPKHRAPRHRRDPRRTGTLAAATASFAVAATATVTLQASGGGGATSSSTASTGITGTATPSVVVAALGRTATGSQRVTRPAYAGAEELTVLQRSVRSRDASRDADRRSSARAEEAAADQRRREDQRDGPARRNGRRGAPQRASQHGSSGAPAGPAWALPVAAGYRLSAGFGECSGLWGRCHTGLDFAAPTGTPVLAVAAGTITEVGWAGAYGNRAVLTLEDGTEVWYCHLDAVTVSLGTEVAAGQPVGTVGTTGNTTGPHLHLEVRPGAGDPVDPSAALAAHGLVP